MDQQVQFADIKMDPEEIKEHFKKADEVIVKGMDESKGNFDRITGMIQQLYSDINKGEIIVATGAFSLVITFLTQHNDSVSYQNVLYLKFAMGFLFFSIVWKFHINRSAAKRAEEERNLINENLGLLGEMHVANTKFLIANDTKALLEAPEILQRVESLEQKKKAMDSQQAKNRGSLMNEIEYQAFFCGIALLLIFFLYNI